MSAALEGIRSAGAVTVAAIVEHTLQHGALPSPWFVGTKRPVAILVHRNGVTAAFEPDGTRMSRDAIEHRHPGLYAEFARRCG